MAATEETLPRGSSRTYGSLRMTQSNARAYKWRPCVRKWCIMMNFEASAWHLASVPTRWYRRMDGIPRAEPDDDRWLCGVRDALLSGSEEPLQRSKLLQQLNSCKCTLSDSHNQVFLIQSKGQIHTWTWVFFASPAKPSLDLPAWRLLPAQSQHLKPALANEEPIQFDGWKWIHQSSTGLVWLTHPALMRPRRQRIKDRFKIGHFKETTRELEAGAHKQHPHLKLLG